MRGDAGQPELRDFLIRCEFIAQKCHEGVDLHCLRSPRRFTQCGSLTTNLDKAGGQSVNLSTTFASWLRGRSKQPILEAEVVRCEATVIGRIAWERSGLRFWVSWWWRWA